MKSLYLASPLGFSPENRSYLAKVKAKLESLGFEIFDPWESKQFAPRIDDACRCNNFFERVALFRQIASEIGGCNEAGIRGADTVFAVLDGAEVDSGTAGEIGFASAAGIKCYGLRTDLRDCGDFVGIPINLQVLYFIERTGGRLFRSIAEIEIDR